MFNTRRIVLSVSNKIKIESSYDLKLSFHIMGNPLTIVLATLFFLVPLLYKRWKKAKIEFADIGNCALAAMGLPNLFLCLYYLLTNPKNALEMAELPQYLTIGVLTILFLTGESILKTFFPPRSP